MFTVKQVGHFHVLKLEKDLTVMNATRFVKQVTEEFLMNGRSKIALHLSEVNVDTFGLASVLRLHQKAVECKGGVCILKPSSTVQTLIKLTDLHKYVKTYDQIEEAIQDA